MKLFRTLIQNPRYIILALIIIIPVSVVVFYFAGVGGELKEFFTKSITDLNAGELLGIIFFGVVFGRMSSK